MSRKDYRCATCDAVELDVVFSIHDEPHPPVCPRDAGHGRMEWAPSFGNTRPLFIPFETLYHGERIRIATVQDARNLEARSLKDYADGRGTPHIFRDLSQDRSNRDVHAIMPKDPAQQAQEAQAQYYREHGRRGPSISVRPISEREADRRENWRGER